MTSINRRAAEQLDPPSRLGQVNEVMRFCEAKKRDGMSVKAVSASESEAKRIANEHMAVLRSKDAAMDGGVRIETGSEIEALCEWRHSCEVTRHVRRGRFGGFRVLLSPRTYIL